MTPDEARRGELYRAAKHAREWTLKRDALIRRESEAGRSLRDIAEEVGLSHTAIAKILAK